MKISSLSVYSVPLASHETYYMAGGKTCDVVESLVVRIDSDEGLTGWGEVCPIPHYLAAYPGGVAPAIDYLSPVLLGADPVGPEALMTLCDRLEASLVAADNIRCRLLGASLHAALDPEIQAQLAAE